jgi:hypothetical protein
VASSHFQAYFANGLVRKRTRVFRGLAFVLKAEHIFYECVGPVYHASGMFLFHVLIPFSARAISNYVHEIFAYVVYA